MSDFGFPAPNLTPDSSPDLGIESKLRDKIGRKPRNSHIEEARIGNVRCETNGIYRTEIQKLRFLRTDD